MAYARDFRDDGDLLVLDLHGCTVDEGLRLVRRALRLGAERGRSRLDVIHGFSSSHTEYDRTIRNAIRDAWDRGDYDAWVQDVRWDDVGGRCALWFRIGGNRDRRLLSVSDLL